jgi:ligand-binding SRPBCC domain-containing protein
VTGRASRLARAAQSIEGRTLISFDRQNGEFVLHAEQWLAAPRDAIFAFFSDPRRLESLTPAWLHFRIIAPERITMGAGTLIDYRLRLRGIPLRWQSEISAWEPPVRFVDLQTRGPYRLWHHEHLFAERDGGTLVTDHVRYRVLGGALVNRFLVAPDLAKIFAFRQSRLSEFFPTAGSSRSNASSAT